jgi:hypothetical protein
VILTHPSNSAHLLQPLGANAYSSLKAHWRNQIDADTNPEESPYRYPLPVQPQFRKQFHVKGRESWLPKIISPLNKNVITPETTAPSVVSDRNQSDGELVLCNPACDPSNMQIARRRTLSTQVPYLVPVSRH